MNKVPWRNGFNAVSRVLNIFASLTEVKVYCVVTVVRVILTGVFPRANTSRRLTTNLKVTVVAYIKACKPFLLLNLLIKGAKSKDNYKI